MKTLPSLVPSARWMRLLPEVKTARIRKFLVRAQHTSSRFVASPNMYVFEIAFEKGSKKLFVLLENGKVIFLLYQYN